MSKVYGMQRANGDWFALQSHTTFRVPVFRTSNDAMHARAFNPEMLLFKPMILDKRALMALAAELNGDSAHFWLVDQAQVNLKRGRQLPYGQVAVLCNEDTVEEVM
jgi:hypothetical protein